jgi:hypothetical protein
MGTRADTDDVFGELRGCFPYLSDAEFQATVVLPIKERLFTQTVNWLFNSLPPDLVETIVSRLREGHAALWSES